MAEFLSVLDIEWTRALKEQSIPRWIKMKANRVQVRLESRTVFRSVYLPHVVAWFLQLHIADTHGCRVLRIRWNVYVPTVSYLWNLSEFSLSVNASAQHVCGLSIVVELICRDVFKVWTHCTFFQFRVAFLKSLRLNIKLELVYMRTYGSKCKKSRKRLWPSSSDYPISLMFPRCFVVLTLLKIVAKLPPYGKWPNIP